MVNHERSTTIVLKFTQWKSLHTDVGSWDYRHKHEEIQNLKSIWGLKKETTPKRAMIGIWCHSSQSISFHNSCDTTPIIFFHIKNEKADK